MVFAFFFHAPARKRGARAAVRRPPAFLRARRATIKKPPKEHFR